MGPMAVHVAAWRPVVNGCVVIAEVTAVNVVDAAVAVVVDTVGRVERCRNLKRGDAVIAQRLTGAIAHDAAGREQQVDHRAEATNGV